MGNIYVDVDKKIDKIASNYSILNEVEIKKTPEQIISSASLNYDMIKTEEKNSVLEKIKRIGVIYKKLQK